MDAFGRWVGEWDRRGARATRVASVGWGHRIGGDRVPAVNIVWGEVCCLARSAGPWIPCPAR